MLSSKNIYDLDLIYTTFSGVPRDLKKGSQLYIDEILLDYIPLPDMTGVEIDRRNDGTNTII